MQRWSKLLGKMTCHIPSDLRQVIFENRNIVYFIAFLRHQQSLKNDSRVGQDFVDKFLAPIFVRVKLLQVYSGVS